MVEADLTISWQNFEPLQESPVSEHHTPTSAQVRDNPNICNDNSVLQSVPPMEVEEKSSW